MIKLSSDYLLQFDMKAAQITSYGDSNSIKVQEVPPPLLKDGYILVKVKAASINPADQKILAGAWKNFMPLNLPSTFGGDYSGVIEEIGSDVTDFKVGDEVYGQASFTTGNGSFAEMVAAQKNNAAIKPSNISFEEAGALPLVGVSALQALTEHINLQKGQKILITGGAGGIGSIAIQIAKYIGAYVTTIVSINDVEFVKQLGADLVIDYTKEKFEDTLADYDAIFDTVGKEEYQKAFNILKKDGIIVSMLRINNTEGSNTVKQISQMTDVTTERLNKLTELIEKNVVKVKIDKIFPLNDIAKAFTSKAKEHFQGKIVIKI